MQDTITETTTAHTLNEMTPYAKRPFSDQLDYRPLPVIEMASGPARMVRKWLM